MQTHAAQRQAIRPRGVNEGLQTRFESWSLADTHDTAGLGAVSKHYPQPAGTRPPVGPVLWWRSSRFRG